MSNTGGETAPSGELSVTKIPAAPAPYVGDEDPAKRTGEPNEIPPPDPR